jgi:hypothetical protein
VRQRWILFAAALAGSALLAGAFGLVVTSTVARPTPAPHLSTVPIATLTRAGYTIAGASVPPYCALQQAGADRRWLPPAAMGCPISRSAAQAAAAPEPGANVLEAVLARVSSARSSVIGQDRLTWLVVVRRKMAVMPMPLCAPTGSAAAGVPSCPRTIQQSGPTVVVFVDARTAEPMEVLPVGTPLARPLPIMRLMPAVTRSQPAVVVPAAGAAQSG